MQMVYFLTVHLLQIVITLYEVIHVFALGGTVGNFAAWAEVLIVANTLLVVFNSSINFAFYCGDTGVHLQRYTKRPVHGWENFLLALA